MVFYRKFRQHDPTLKTPDPDAVDFDPLHDIAKLIKGMGIERSDYEGVLDRVKRESPNLVAGIFADWKSLRMLAAAYGPALKKR